MYCGDSVITLEEAYKEWMLWRASVNTSSKTLKENKCEWNGYIKDTALSQMQVAKIEISDFEDFLYDLSVRYRGERRRMFEQSMNSDHGKSIFRVLMQV